MNCGKHGLKNSSRLSGNTSNHFHSQPRDDGPSGSVFYKDEAKFAANRGQMRKQKQHNEHQSASAYFQEHGYHEEFPPLAEGQANKRKMMIDLGPEQKAENIVSSKPEDLPISNYGSQPDDSSPSTPLKNKGMPPACAISSQSSQSDCNHGAGTKKFNSSGGWPNIEPFDICLSRRRHYIEQNVEMTRGGVLRPGMVLLKYYLSIREQIKIVRTCQELGKGPGGFYQPGYNDGAKLRLHMMCLGLNWNPQTRKYEKVRSVDSCEPPGIPNEFILLVQRALSEAHSLIMEDSEVSNVEDILPAMSPDICIVNFYKTSGRLGLHKDRDESKDSLKKALPVVSFSIGDSADFLYGDNRDVEKAEKVLLESGDVLIFGGDSRHIFHGVSSIIPKSAPWALRDNTMLRPGRLNLTFRQY
ncbi:Alpha-ketoglutarate-dependent dioxygenase AlkB [Melia azedarach]|uniref:Alpha-ketoglutarate-dependent dioxygenase AlkB n=1 Tax=Melia azedarach TaxID=155640 RepID=A0ACC1WZU7_MELAZ|nr:Alpha-ketoglutarate-dependent dioxygenase AlkB [Melia azedarach]